ncbi:35897_t:CDS:2, partial [Gigaspora margarita]
EEYNLLVNQFVCMCDLEEKYFNLLTYLNFLEQYGILVNATKTAIESQLVIQANLKKKYKEIINRYENKKHEFSLDYFDYYQVPNGKKKINETFEECAIYEAKEEAVKKPD